MSDESENLLSERENKEEQAARHGHVDTMPDGGPDIAWLLGSLYWATKVDVSWQLPKKQRIEIQHSRWLGGR